MTPTTNPTTRRPLDEITGHTYTLPVVREIPIAPAPGSWDATW